ncbi:13941_t:CDS:2 [Entrophospora sp. SA101]|nr:13941_t:CDS:2 [Entrophospora sp. SA101]
MQDPSNLPTIPLVCFDVTHDPIAKIERSLRVSIANIDQNDDPNLVIQQLTNNISNLKLPKKWGTIDTTTLYYRIGTWKDSLHHDLKNEISYKSFWDEFSKRKSEVQLIVYTRQPAINKPASTQDCPYHRNILRMLEGRFNTQIDKMERSRDPIANIRGWCLLIRASRSRSSSIYLERYVAKSLQHSGFARTFRKYLDNHDKRMIVEHVLYENGIGLLDDIDSYLEII